MQRLLFVILALVLAVPLTFARAQTSATVEGSASTGSSGATVEAQGEVKPRPPLPKPLPLIKDAAAGARNNIQAIASSTRANLTGLASTTRAEIKTRTEVGKENIRAIMGEKRDEARAQMEEKRAAMEVRVEAAKEKAAERWGAAVQNHVRVIVERLKAAVERLDELAGRTEDRIEKLQATGLAMTDSVALMAEARADIRVASDDAAAVSASLEVALASDAPKEHMDDVRAAIKKADDSIKAAKDSLGAVLKSIRAEAGANVNASSTVQ